MALLAALALVLVEDGWRRGLRWLRLPVGIGILALASLPWLLPYLLQTERSYVGGVVVGHYGDWYFRERTGSSRLESLQENLVRFLPWTLFLPAGLWWWWRDRDPRRRPLLVWTLVTAVAVSLSERAAGALLPAGAAAAGAAGGGAAGARAARADPAGPAGAAGVARRGRCCWRWWPRSPCSGRRPGARRSCRRPAGRARSSPRWRWPAPRPRWGCWPSGDRESPPPWRWRSPSAVS